LFRSMGEWVIIQKVTGHEKVLKTIVAIVGGISAVANAIYVTHARGRAEFRAFTQSIILEETVGISRP